MPGEKTDMSDYRDWLEETQGYVDSTVNQYVTVARSLVDFLGTKRLTEERYRDWIQHLKETEMAASSVKTYYRISRRYLVYESVNFDPGVVRGEIPDSDPNSLPEPLTQDQVRQIRDACEDAEEEALIVVLYHTGLRNSEVRALTWGDVDWQKKELTVSRRKKKGWGRDTLPLYDDQLSVLEALRDLRSDDNPHIFPAYKTPQGVGATYTEPAAEGFMSGSTVRNRVQDVVDRSEVDRPVWPHLFRHTRATHLLENGEDATYVNQFLDHEKMETTLRYARLTGETLRESEAADSGDVFEA